MKLRKPYQSRLLGGTETWNGLVPQPRVVDEKFRMSILGVSTPSPTSDPLVQGSSARKINPHNFCCKNQWVTLSQCKKLMESQAVPLKNPHTDLLRFNPSEFQHQGRSLKGTSGILRGSWETSFPQREMWAEAIVPFLNPPPATEPQSLQAGTITKTP